MPFQRSQFTAQVYEVVAAIPPGRVATYQQVALWAGYPGYARHVGHALYQLTTHTTPIPWHRVINSQGKISQNPHRQGSDIIQYQRLQREGIPITHIDQKIDLATVGWDPESLLLELPGFTSAPSQTP